MVLVGPNLVGQQASRLDFLGEFDFEIVYRPVSRHRNADALSQRSGRTCVFCRRGLPNRDLENRTAEVVVTPAAAKSVQTPGDWTPAELAKAQAVDPELTLICG